MLPLLGVNNLLAELSALDQLDDVRPSQEPLDVATTLQADEATRVKRVISSRDDLEQRALDIDGVYATESAEASDASATCRANIFIPWLACLAWAVGNSDEPGGALDVGSAGHSWYRRCRRRLMLL